MKPECTFPVPELRWEEILRNSSDATIFHTPGWSRVIADVFGYRPATRLYETDEGEVLIPLMAMNGLGFTTLASMPLGYGGIFSEDVSEETIGKILAELVRGRILKLYLTLPPCARMTIPQQAPLARFESEWNYCQILNLSGGPEATLGRTNRSIRRHIRDAERCGVEVVADDSIEGYHDFYALYSARSRDWGYTKPPHTFSLYEAIHRHLRPHARLLLAKKDGVTIGGVILLMTGRMPSAWMLTWTKTVPDSFPGAALIHRAIMETCENGAEFFNFGGSGQLQGVRRYKDQWGAEEIEVPRYIYPSRLNHLAAGFLKNRVRREEPDGTQEMPIPSSDGGSA